MAGNIGGYVSPGGVIGGVLDVLITSGGFPGPGTVSTATIASGAVGTSQLGPASVQSGQIASGSIGAIHIQVGGLGSGAIASGSLGQFVLGSGAVTNTALGNNAVSSGNISSGSIGQFAFGSGAVTGVALASGAVQSGNIASGSIGSFHISNGGVLSGDIGSGQVSYLHLASGSVVGQLNNFGDSLASQTLLNQTAANSGLVYTATATGLYRVSSYTIITQGGLLNAGSLSVQLVWTDDTQIQSGAPITGVALLTSGAYGAADTTVRMISGAALIATQALSSVTGAPHYNSYIAVERVA